MEDEDDESRGKGKKRKKGGQDGEFLGRSLIKPGPFSFPSRRPQLAAR
jgi:hypothetical protein